MSIKRKEKKESIKFMLREVVVAQKNRTKNDKNWNLDRQKWQIDFQVSEKDTHKHTQKKICNSLHMNDNNRKLSFYLHALWLSSSLIIHSSALLFLRCAIITVAKYSFQFLFFVFFLCKISIIRLIIQIAMR